MCFYYLLFLRRKVHSTQNCKEDVKGHCALTTDRKLWDFFNPESQALLLEHLPQKI